MFFEGTVQLQLRANQEKNRLWKCYATIPSYYVYTEHIFRLAFFVLQKDGQAFYIIVLQKKFKTHAEFWLSSKTLFRVCSTGLPCLNRKSSEAFLQDLVEEYLH